MQFINTQTQKVVARKDLSKRTNRSFPSGRALTDDDLQGTDYRVLGEGTKPAGEAWHVIEQDGVAQTDGEWNRAWVKRSMTADEVATHKLQLKAALKAHRLSVEEGGFDYGQMRINSDEKTERRIIGARVKAEADSTYTVDNWKVGDSFAQLNAATIIAISDALNNHVSGCFDAEATVAGEIDSGTHWSVAEATARFDEVMNGA